MLLHEAFYYELCPNLKPIANFLKAQGSEKKSAIRFFGLILGIERERGFRYKMRLGTK